jgi:amylosucrase
MARVVLFLANVGVEVLRLDAIAFLWKRLGTDCQNQPEVHQLTRALHALTRIACPAVIFKAEAIVGPADLAAYLGTGPLWGKVSDLAYHNSLMVQVWSMLAAKDVRLASHALRALPRVPATTAWVTYLRGHDDIGWAVSDADAAAVGADGYAHRAFLSDWYAGEFAGSDARGLVFQHNPATGDRRISGTSASLVGLEAARAAGDDAWIDAALARLLLGHAIVLSWGGVPVVWSGDELGLPNDPSWADEPGHEDDNRWANRPRLDPAAVARLDDPTSLESRVFGGLRHLAGVRAGLPHLHASVAAEVLGPDDPGVLLVARRHPVGVLLAAANVTGDWRPVTGDRLRELGLVSSTDAITGDDLAPGEDGNLWLAPWRAVWLVAR